MKSAAAFRTISEVSDELAVPQHVLRFWETKFPQIRPLKRGGGRRYYRPEDVDLLRRVCRLLYHEGYTIRGVQRLLREGVLKGALRPIAPGGAPEIDAVQALPLGLPELEFPDFAGSDDLAEASERGLFDMDDAEAEEEPPKPVLERRPMPRRPRGFAATGPVDTRAVEVLREILGELEALRGLLRGE
jgi:DNA-binding transcriptional MerR regulator